MIGLMFLLGLTACEQNKKSAEAFTCESLRFFNIAEKYSSLITLLWHQDVLDDVDYPYLGQIYERLLQYLQRKKAFVGSGKEIMEWWVNREAIKVVDEEIEENQIIWELKADTDINNISFTISGCSQYKNQDILGIIDHYEIDKKGLVHITEIKKGQSFKIVLHK